MPAAQLTTFDLDEPVDFRLTLGPIKRGPADPTMRVSDNIACRATRTPDGPASLRLANRGHSVVVEAWGPGADWATHRVPWLVGACDDRKSFEPRHPLVRKLHRRHPGLRIARTGAVFEALVATILEQKVPSIQAQASYRALVLAIGEPAPGPDGLFLPPTPESVARTPYWVFHRAGVERRRADTIRRAALIARRLEEMAAFSGSDARRRLTAVPGIGEWSAAEVALVALGDADALSVGDYHLPHLVSWAFTGRPRGTDAGMLALLEPFRGHRARVVRLLEAAGISAPRFGPRMAFRDIRWS